ncbi:MAG: winged helix-turn-helix transcriptional regulator [Dehalococcoidia bacterium]|nr:MAG: winged helix-turn-helix transcriptional regulator [Dehalococcoidia bacterium]
MKNLTKAAQALSDETRIRILNLIMQRECCVCEVMQALNISQTRASRNLKILYDAGFLSMRNDGLFTLYSLKSKNNKDVHRYLFNAIGESLKKNPIALKDLKRLDKAKRVGLKSTSKMVM